MESPDALRQVRICHPAFQDMHHLVLPRLSGRAQLRRQVLKLRFLVPYDPRVGDLTAFRIPGERLFVLAASDGFGLGDGLRVVFRDVPNPQHGGTICVLAVLGVDEPPTAAALCILRGREQVARERLGGGL